MATHTPETRNATIVSSTNGGSTKPLPLLALSAAALLLAGGTGIAALGPQQTQAHNPPPRPMHPAGNSVGPAGNAEGPLAPALDAPKPAVHDGPIVQLALLLDTSNSMDGLIDQARAELWTVVNQLRGLRHDAGDVQLQIALYQYGNDRLESADGYVQLRAPFTTDLDTISEQLFALTTDGGSEYCGWAIGEASQQLEWVAPTNDADAPPTLRMIVVAGNEPFSQGSRPYTSTIPEATNKGVRVHTVFCGSQEEGERTFWNHGAEIGEGFSFAIDQSASIEFETPFDAKILSLNESLNGTYLRFGSLGAPAAARQAMMDTLNEASNEQAVQRAAAKASDMYRNAHWDLVDAEESGEVELAELDKDELPEELRELSVEELEAHISEKRIERARISKEITDLVRQREEDLAAQRQAAGIVTLGHALSAAIIEQSRELGFTHESDQAIEPIAEPLPEPIPHEAPLEPTDD